VVALDPRYGARKTRELVTGDVRGRMKLSSQGWLGRSDHVLHQGEGAIQAVAWQGVTLAWANAVGVKVRRCRLALLGLGLASGVLLQQHCKRLCRPCRAYP